MIKQNKPKDLLTTAGGLLLFLGMLIIIFIGASGIARSTDEEGLTATYKAIERASVLCYSTEGFYPPGLTYIEENYGLQIDRDRYVVRYEVFSSKEKPMIRVLKK